MFLLLLIFIYLAININGWFWAAAPIVLLLFVFLVKKNGQIKEYIQIYDQLLYLHQQEITCQQYDFESYDDGREYMDMQHPYSSDLDIFGRKSLFQFINRTQTIWGRDRLAGYLTSFTTIPDEITMRQDSINELCKYIGLRQKFWAYACYYKMDGNEYNQLIDLLNTPLGVVNSKFFRFCRAILPLLFLIIFVCAMLNILPWQPVLLLFGVNWIITGMYIKTTNQKHSSLENQNRRFATILDLLALIQVKSFNAKKNVDLKNKLFSDQHNSRKELLRFKKIVKAFDFRLNIIMNLILNGSILWDLQCLNNVEKWRSRYSKNIPVYFETIGEFDAMFCLGNFAFNHPGNNFPSISNKYLFHATDLGHPLISPEQRVNNSLTINQQGLFIIVTGANMAGKSTFLRTIGINQLLACNGLPVIASHFSFTPMPLFTSMRTKDSLGENESYFYAELKRLHQLVELISQGTRPFIMLDEILKGTNSADKLKGSIAFLNQLIRKQCTGIIATHDLALTELEKDYPDHIRNKCFEIQIENGKMHFDYKLLNGVTQHMNALLLMKQMNIISDQS
jgi:DNA mismatch repair ATPase MutS